MGNSPTATASSCRRRAGGHVVLGQRVLADEPAALAHVELEGKVTVVGETRRAAGDSRWRCVGARAEYARRSAGTIEAQGQVPVPLANALPGRVVALDIAPVFLREREPQRPRVDVDVGLPVGDLGHRQRPHQRVEVGRVVAASGLERLRSAEPSGGKIVEIADILAAVVTGRRARSAGGRWPDPWSGIAGRYTPATGRPRLRSCPAGIRPPGSRSTRRRRAARRSRRAPPARDERRRPRPHRGRPRRWRR